jgi:hypothetical protein
MKHSLIRGVVLLHTKAYRVDQSLSQGRQRTHRCRGGQGEEKAEQTLRRKVSIRWIRRLGTIIDDIVRLLLPIFTKSQVDQINFSKTDIWVERSDF